MRKKDKEITDRTLIESIILSSPVCRLAFSDNDYPYIVPLCFGYRDNALYFHTAREGKKLDILRKNNNVCFEFDIDHELVTAKSACQWSMKYSSVIGFGKAFIIDDPESKRRALDIIIGHYSGSSLSYDKAKAEIMVIVKVDIESMTGKKSGYSLPEDSP